jgi:hypothetical protein
MNKTGMKLTMIVAGPAYATKRRLRVAASGYAGATDDTATTVASNRLSVPARSDAVFGPRSSGGELQPLSK